MDLLSYPDYKSVFASGRARGVAVSVQTTDEYFKSLLTDLS